MLDVSIKELRKALTSEKKRTEFLRKRITVTEKFDGTKLTLIRNGEPYDPYDYTKNWVVSYKGNVLFPGEYAGLPEARINGEVRRMSIGTSQYGLVHEHLKRYASSIIPKNTELFVEFIQNKPTLTRDYEEMHDLYLLGYASSDHIIYGQRVFTTATEMQTTENFRYAKALGIKQPPVVFEGPASELGTVDDIIAKYENFTSSLGGKAEGVVIKTEDGELYKVVSPDQYDKELRRAKKARWALIHEKETEYWKVMNEQAEEVMRNIPFNLPTNSFLRELSEKVYNLKPAEIRAQNRKKSPITLQDDLFLTAKLQHERSGRIPYDAHRVGVMLMSGKPVHNGHWKMIERMSEENDVCYLYVSIKDRGLKDDDTIRGGDALMVWKDFLLARLPENLVVRFSDQPRLDAIRDVQAFQENTVRNGLSFYFYGDSVDAPILWSPGEFRSSFPILYGFGRLHMVAVDRNDTELISGTKMRWMLRMGDEGHKFQFMMHLPHVLTREDKARIWDFYRSRL